ncbi:MAG: DUF2085 domain-containing protein [Candidatus Micrarchaeota archaeon]|nr:DUF2085 domain-containing protein [Candidatus Micrarchaeota archaeon]
MPKLPYFLLLFALIGLNALIFLTAFLAAQGNDLAHHLYFLFSPSCHQLTSRSLCLFKYDASERWELADCLPVSRFSPSKANVVFYPEKTGFKLPVCSRDAAIYLFMLVGALLLPFFRSIESKAWPNKLILLAAAIPIGIDGTGQFLGLWESTNAVRIATGALIGFVLPFFILPILNALFSDFLFSRKKHEKKRH